MTRWAMIKKIVKKMQNEKNHFEKYEIISEKMSECKTLLAYAYLHCHGLNWIDNGQAWS